MKRIYFDHASTSHPKPLEVVEGISYYLNHIGASPGRGEYALSNDAENLIYEARKALAEEYSISDPKHIFFTYNATHALNIILKGFLRAGDHVVITNFEHNAVVRPLHKLANEKSISYTVFSSDTEGMFNVQEIENSILPQTKLIVANHASNVIGVISPIEQISRFANSKGIPLLVDVSQTAGSLPLDVTSCSVDFIAGTGHKGLLGPSGVGFFYAKNPDLIDTLYEGGGGVNSASKFHPQSIPMKFEAGTLNYLGIVGLLHSMRYIRKHGRHALFKLSMELTQKALVYLKEIPGILVYGSQNIESKIPVISFNVTGLYAAETAYLLDQKGICVRGGLQCAPLIHQTLKTFPQGTVRMSFGHQNTIGELEQMIENLAEIVQFSKERCVEKVC